MGPPSPLWLLGPRNAASNGPCRIPATASPPTSSSSSAAAEPGCCGGVGQSLAEPVGRGPAAAMAPRSTSPRINCGTELVNGGMSLQALMALLGHVSAEMTLRYASLASPTVRVAYDQAMSKARSRLTLPIAPVGQAIVPDRVQWLRAEMLKTRLAHGYCSRSLAAEACSYANICEQCDNFTTSIEFVPTLESQLTDVTALREDAEARGWDTEVARHARVISHLTRHLDRLAHSEPPSGTT